MPQQRSLDKRGCFRLARACTKTAQLESLDYLKRRRHEAAKCIDLERLSIGPQCGFASTVAGNPLTEAEQRAKLERLVEAARSTWP